VNSLVLRVAARYLITLLMLFAVFLLLRGHNEPGGGFIAGLVVASGHALYVLAFGTEDPRGLLRVDPQMLMSGGIAVALLSALPGIAEGGTPLTAVWEEIPMLGESSLKIGSPLVFDLGVFFTVVGSSVSILRSLSEEA